MVNEHELYNSNPSEMFFTRRYKMAVLVSSTKVAALTQFLIELAEPARISILEALPEGPLHISGLVLVTGLDQPTLYPRHELYRGG